MTIFLDTSSLLKLYHKESETVELISFIGKNIKVIYLSELAKIEFNSAIYKKVRTKEITKEKAESIVSFFQNDYSKFEWIKLDSDVVNLAKDLISQYGTDGLRTLDSLQLASAVSKKIVINYYKTSDKLLFTIFEKEGLNVI